MTMTPLPVGFGVAFDPETVEIAPGVLFGGSPSRVMRLSPAGRDALAELRDGSVGSRPAGRLARTLSDAGMLHPRPPAVTTAIDATVVIPVRDRHEKLAKCLSALGTAYPVIVVDDGSREPDTIAAIATQHGASILHRDRNGGPAAARNTGLSRVATDVVVFVDSDCVPTGGWIEQLAAHLADPTVAVVAPRIMPLPSPAATTVLGRYNAVSGSLDLGDREARVFPLSRVAYVPTAALVVRRKALVDVARGTDVFDPALTSGEDVDLIWRLHAAGWRIRYDPTVHVHHHEPETWPALLSRRFHYGTSAPQLAIRHPDAIPPLVLHPLPTVTVAATLAGQPVIAAAAYAVSVADLTRRLRAANVPTRGVAPAMLRGAHQTWLGVGRYALQFGAPLLATALLAGKRPAVARRLAAASLLLGPGLAAWRTRRPQLDPARFTVASIADDVAYGSGVWYASARHRTLAALRPAIKTRPLRIDPPAHPDRSTP